MLRQRKSSDCYTSTAGVESKHRSSAKHIMAMDYKTEDSTYIKPEPAIGSPIAEDNDDDTYEDTGELEFPRKIQQAWLVRLPKSLYAKWNALEADEPVQIGTIRHWKKSNMVRNMWLGILMRVLTMICR